MVQHITSLQDVNIQNTFLTIGSFDGVHLGHQHLLQELNYAAHLNGGKSTVLTFHPHPSVILRGRTGPFYLTTPAEKVELLDQLGTDIVVTHPFTYEISQSTARDYVTYLMTHLGFSQLWVGYDFALGKGREGKVPYLKKLGEELDYQVNVIQPVVLDGRIISSSLIRQLITEGNVYDASKYLGRPYRLEGEVVHGDGRGKGIGIPTANLEIGNEKIIPATGVYACRAQVSEEIFPAAVNIGTRPTFDSNDHRSHVEAHILDFSKDLYTQKISIEFIARLRGEVKFQSVEDLIQQVHADIDQTREIIIRQSK
ncbi:MAG: bifunctional riboflavin kinase/FAD synthetase [Anaerolineales bacterium]